MMRKRGITEKTMAFLLGFFFFQPLLYAQEKKEPRQAARGQQPSGTVLEMMR